MNDLLQWHTRTVINLIWIDVNEEQMLGWKTRREVEKTVALSCVCAGFFLLSAPGRSPFVYFMHAVDESLNGRVSAVTTTESVSLKINFYLRKILGPGCKHRIMIDEFSAKVMSFKLARWTSPSALWIMDRWMWLDGWMDVHVGQELFRSLFAASALLPNVERKNQEISTKIR